MTAYAYVRVSTDEQAESRAGLDAQRDAIERYAAKEGLSIAADAWHADEGISGSEGIERRPGLLAALDVLGAGDVLIVAKRDRLARDVMLACFIEKEVKRRKARIVSAAGEGTEDDSPTGRLMRQIVDAFAEYERAVIAARTSAALQAKLRRGERVGGNATFGYELAQGPPDTDGRPTVIQIPNAIEQAAVSRMVELKERKYSLRHIAKVLEREGFTSRVGKRIGPQTVSNVLKREAAKNEAGNRFKEAV